MALSRARAAWAAGRRSRTRTWRRRRWRSSEARSPLRPQGEMMRVARPAAALVLLIAGLAGCAGRVLPCDGIPIPVHVDIDPGPVPSEFSEIADKLPHLFRVRAACVDARHDPQTEQGRWVYWVELEAKRSAASLGIEQLEF